jgi:hypothetical protein
LIGSKKKFADSRKIAGLSYRTMESDILNEMSDESVPSPGPVPFKDEDLSARRNSLVMALSSWWAEIGWEVTTAETRSQLRNAFKPLENTANRTLIEFFLHPTSTLGTAKRIRFMRRQHEKEMTRRRKAQAENDKCTAAYEEAEWAMSAAKPEQIEIVQRIFSERRNMREEALTELTAAKLIESKREGELRDIQAGFAQDQLLEFIKTRFIKGRYAKTPINVANAMAGLPSYNWGPFLGAWYSYGRCSKLECENWPHFAFQVFKTIQKIWSSYQQRPSIPSAVEFFREQIRALPKLVRSMTAQSQKLAHSRKRIANPVRAHLVDKWIDLQLALEQSLIVSVEPERMPFIIGTHFSKVQLEPKTAVDKIIASSRAIDD